MKNEQNGLVRSGSAQNSKQLKKMNSKEESETEGYDEAECFHSEFQLHNNKPKNKGRVIHEVFDNQCVVASLQRSIDVTGSDDNAIN